MMPQRIAGRIQSLTGNNRSVRPLTEYAVAVGAAMGSNFAVVLALVYLMPESGYAAIVLAKAILFVIASVAGLGISQAVVRYAGTSADPGEVFATSLMGALLLSIPGAAVMALAFDWLDTRIQLELSTLKTLLIWLTLAAYMGATEVTNWPRAIHNSATFARLSVLRAVLQLVAVAGNVAVLRSTEAYLLGILAGEIIYIALVFAGSRRPEFPGLGVPDLGLLGRMLAYGWPHGVTIASALLLNSGDRFMISHLIPDQAAVAYYDAAYIVIASGVAILIRPFNLFIFPSYIRQYQKQGREPTEHLLGRALTYFTAGALLIALVLSVVSAPLLTLFYPPGYASAASIFPPVALGLILNGIYIGVVAGVYVTDKPWPVAFTCLIAFAVNVAANFILIPAYGLNGAAYATTLAFFVQLLVSYAFARQKLRPRLPLAMLIGGAILLALVHWIS